MTDKDQSPPIEHVDSMKDLFFHSVPKADICQHDFQGWREFGDEREGKSAHQRDVEAVAYALLKLKPPTDEAEVLDWAKEAICALEIYRQLNAPSAIAEAVRAQPKVGLNAAERHIEVCRYPEDEPVASDPVPSAIAEVVLAADAAPVAAKFTNVEDMLNWLDAPETASSAMDEAVREEPAEWQPIKTAPKDGTNIILTNGKQVLCGYWGEWHQSAFLRQRDNWCSYWPVEELGTQPTFWQPMPSVPRARATTAEKEKGK